MPTIKELKDRVNAAIDRQADQLIKTAKTILNNPEPGFREFKTAKLVGEVFDSFGIAHQDGIGITGLKGYLDGATQGPTVGVMGELDSLKVQGHPTSIPKPTPPTPAATTARLA